MEWKYSTGFVSEEMVKEHLFPYTEGSIAVLCGPPPMIKSPAQSGQARLPRAGMHSVLGFILV